MSWWENVIELEGLLVMTKGFDLLHVGSVVHIVIRDPLLIIFATGIQVKWPSILGFWQKMKTLLSNYATGIPPSAKEENRAFPPL